MAPAMSEFEMDAIQVGACWYVKADITPEQRVSLDTALADRRYSSVGIQRTIKKWGVNPSVSVVKNHRNGDCSCR